MWLFIHRPFEVWPSLGDYHIERVYMLGTLLYWACCAQKTWTRNRLNFAFLLLAITLVTSVMMSPYNPGINQIVEDWLKIGVFYVLVMSTVRNKEQLRFLVAAFLVVMALYLGHSFREFLNGRHFYRMGIGRLIGVATTMNDPNTFGATILYSLPMIYPLWYETRKRWQRVLLVSYVLLACGCILLTGSRSVFVGLGVLSIAAAMFSKHRYVVALGLVLAAPIIWVNLREDLQNRYMTLIDPSMGPANAQVSANSRLAGWWDGVKMWKEHPLLGVGPGSFGKARGYNLESHHLYGQILGEIGTVGAVAFACLIWAFYSNQRAAHRLGIDGGEMRTGQELAHHLGGFSGVDQIVDDQHALAAELDDRIRYGLEHGEFALRLVVVVALDADRLDQPNIELARDDRGRDEPAARDGDNRGERPRRGEPPGQRPRIAVELIPGDRKRLLGLRLCLGLRLRHESVSPSARLRASSTRYASSFCFSECR
jgi:O-antigen ligase